MSIVFGLHKEEGRKVHIDDYDKRTMTGKVFCPHCDSELIAKQGSVKAHHYAHKIAKECDEWLVEKRNGMTAPMTQWHREWQSLVKDEYVEVRVTEGDTYHIADIKIEDLVIELQYSYLSPTKIKEREDFYGNMMLWIFRDENVEPILKLKDYLLIKIKRSNINYVQKPLFIDSSYGLLEIKHKIDLNYMLASLISYEDFIKQYLISFAKEGAKLAREVKPIELEEERITFTNGTKRITFSGPDCYKYSGKEGLFRKNLKLEFDHESKCWYKDLTPKIIEENKYEQENIYHCEPKPTEEQKCNQQDRLITNQEESSNGWIIDSGSEELDSDSGSESYDWSTRWIKESDRYKGFVRKDEYKKLKRENERLRNYEDECWEMQKKLKLNEIELNKCQSENLQLRDKLSEWEYNKSKSEELKRYQDDNCQLKLQLKQRELDHSRYLQQIKYLQDENIKLMKELQSLRDQCENMQMKTTDGYSFYAKCYQTGDYSSILSPPVPPLHFNDIKILDVTGVNIIKIPELQSLEILIARDRKISYGQLGSFKKVNVGYISEKLNSQDLFIDNKNISIKLIICNEGIYHRIT